MPHVKIKCIEGKTEEQKREAAQKIAEAIAETFGCGTSAVSVAVEDIHREDWKTAVWDTEISPEMDKLYKKPGYSLD